MLPADNSYPLFYLFFALIRFLILGRHSHSLLSDYHRAPPKASTPRHLPYLHCLDHMLEAFQVAVANFKHVHTHNVHNCTYMRKVHCNQLHCISLDCTAFWYIILCYIEFHFITFHCMTLHCMKLTTLHCIVLHFITCIHTYAFCFKVFYKL